LPRRLKLSAPRIELRSPFSWHQFFLASSDFLYFPVKPLLTYQLFE